MADPRPAGAEQRSQIKAGEGGRHLRRKRILAVLVVVVATTYTVPKGMKQVVVMRFPRVWTERCVWIGRNGHHLKHWGGLLIRQNLLTGKQRQVKLVRTNRSHCN